MEVVNGRIWKIVAHIEFKFYSVASRSFSTGSTLRDEPQGERNHRRRCRLYRGVRRENVCSKPSSVQHYFFFPGASSGLRKLIPHGPVP